MIRNFIYFFLLVLLFSCGKIGLYSNPKGGKVATVANLSLYEEDIANYFLTHPYLTDSDSIALRRAFVNSWIKDQVLQYAANEQISQSPSLVVDEIEDRVRLYRNQLILFEFENSYVESFLDTVIASQDVIEYYNSHLSSYKLVAPIIKCSIARIPAGVRQSAKLENLFNSRKSEDLNEFAEICNKNSYLVYDYTDNWVDLSEVIKIVPISLQNADKIFSRREFYSIEDDTWLYMIKRKDYLGTGAFIPIELEVPNIKKILLHDRRMTLRYKFEDSILNSAYSKGLISTL